MKYSCKDIQIIKSQKIRNENLVIYNEVDKTIFRTRRFFFVFMILIETRPRVEH